MKKNIAYNTGEGINKNWIVTETEFIKENQLKFEAVFSIGNGYMGSRGTQEEEYLGRQLGFFKSGTYNSTAENEAPELPNAANPWDIQLKVDGEEFTLDKYALKSYERNLNIRNGSVERKVNYSTNSGINVNYETSRFISLDNEHVLGQAAKVIVDKDTQLFFKSGVNGESTNYGSQHFKVKELTYKNKVMELNFETTKSKVGFSWHKVINVYINGEKVVFGKDLIAGSSTNRRKMLVSGMVNVKAGDVVEYETIATLHTTRDIKYVDENGTIDSIANDGKELIESIRNDRYSALLQKNEDAWNKYYSETNLKIDTEDDWEIISNRYAQFKTRNFTDYTDWRINIDAKGLSSARYRGHSFWDTEAYVVPYFVMANPQIARNLLKSVYFMKQTAIDKSSELGYKGYSWPWESAWKDNGEACSKFSFIDINTGEKVESKFYYSQIHRGLDIIISIEQYFKATNDLEFLKKYGFDLIFGSLEFYLDWIKFDESKQQYVMNGVTGPNEYKDDIDNNAFTNHMLNYAVELATKYYEEGLLEGITTNIPLDEVYKKAKEVQGKIYLPQANEEGIIPENDTFLSLPMFDWEQYHKDMADPTIENKYNSVYYNKFQILKQADLVMLFNNLPKLFDDETTLKNFDFYDERSFHHSSLSNAPHAIVANRLGKGDVAYKFYRNATELDLGTNMKSCEEGLHSAALTSISLIVYRAFAGIDSFGDVLEVNPSLPEKWNSLELTFHYRGNELKLTATKSNVKIELISGHKADFQIKVFGNEYTFSNELTVNK